MLANVIVRSETYPLLFQTLKYLEDRNMDFSHLGVESSAIIAAFLASTVEVVEAFTIVLAVGTLRGWRPAWIGTFSALILLALAIIIFGPLLGRVPISNWWSGSCCCCSGWAGYEKQY